jgi:hypothetical protein
MTSGTRQAATGAGRGPDHSAPRRAAAIATAVAVPLTVLLAFLLTRPGTRPGTSGQPGAASGTPRTGTGPVTVAAPEHADDATKAACVAVFARLPVQLGTLPARKTDSDSSFVAAWGEPATVLRCGVNRPGDLTPRSAALVVDVNGVQWLPKQAPAATVFTTIDRAVYIEVTVPSVRAFDPALSDAVRALPAVCAAQNASGTEPTTRLCTRRG